MTARPYRIEVSDEVLDDLNRRLKNTRFPTQLDAPAWSMGGDVDYLRDLCDYWRTTFDWRAQEARVNSFPQFMCAVDGLDLHYLHVRGEGSNPMPLLLIHGWPGSIVEFLELIDPLANPSRHGGSAEDSFDVVVASLPGYGFSGQPTVPGWNITRIANAFNVLMTTELGYDRYAVQGGDWGAIVTSNLGLNHADHVLGIHLNMPIGQPPPGTPDDDPDRARIRAFRTTGVAYSALQRTKPDSVTVGHTDSPAGLAAWIIEKFRAWSDCDGDVESAVSRDTLLTNLMFYWAPASAASAARLYYEASKDPGGAFGMARVDVPTGVASFPAEPFGAPRPWVEASYNVTRWTDMQRGGHFAALEQPEALIGEIRSFFHDLR